MGDVEALRDGPAERSGGDSWRTWLLTGVRSGASDRRRVQGAHRGLKKILIEGTGREPEPKRSWQDFSGAMVRQAVNEALHELPAEQKQVLKLEYFGGLSNAEIARQLGLSVGGVQRRLRQALERISEYVEHGRAAGRRAMFGLLIWLPGRRLGSGLAPAVDHMVRVAALVAAGAAVAAIAVAAPASPARHQPAAHAGAGTAVVKASPPAAIKDLPAVKVPKLSNPVPRVLPVPVPPLPSLPPLPKTPTL
jgi:RNA polymerase sigma factor (sigma-70 family)